MASAHSRRRRDARLIALARTVAACQEEGATALPYKANSCWSDSTKTSLPTGVLAATRSISSLRRRWRPPRGLPMRKSIEHNLNSLPAGETGSASDFPENACDRFNRHPVTSATCEAVIPYLSRVLTCADFWRGCRAPLVVSVAQSCRCSRDESPLATKPATREVCAAQPVVRDPKEAGPRLQVSARKAPRRLAARL